MYSPQVAHFLIWIHQSCFVTMCDNSQMCWTTCHKLLTNQQRDIAIRGHILLHLILYFTCSSNTHLLGVGYLDSAWFHWYEHSRLLLVFHIFTHSVKSTIGEPTQSVHEENARAHRKRSYLSLQVQYKTLL